MLQRCTLNKVSVFDALVLVYYYATIDMYPSVSQRLCSVGGGSSSNSGYYINRISIMYFY